MRVSVFLGLGEQLQGQPWTREVARKGAQPTGTHLVPTHTSEGSDNTGVEGAPSGVQCTPNPKREMIQNRGQGRGMGQAPTWGRGLPRGLHFLLSDPPLAPSLGKVQQVEARRAPQGPEPSGAMGGTAGGHRAGGSLLLLVSVPHYWWCKYGGTWGQLLV